MFYTDDLLEQWLRTATHSKRRLVRLGVGLPLSVLAGFLTICVILSDCWQGDE